MQDEILNIKNEAIAQIIEAKSAEELENIRVNYLGRNGKLSQLIKNLSTLSISEKKQAGRLINEIKGMILKQLSQHKNSLKNTSRTWFDPTIPGQKPGVGHLHLITRAIEEISGVFQKIGFTRVRYPEVEWDWYSFGSLNFDKWHPARDDWETFWVDVSEHKKFGPMLL